MRLRHTLLASAVLTTALTTGCASAGTPTAARPTGAPRGASAGAPPVASASHLPPPVPAAASTPAAHAAPTVPAAPTAGASGRYDPSRDAAADLAAALKLSAADSRPVLLDFGADWCPDCHVLDRLFRSPEVQPILSTKYHVVSIDVGAFDHNLDVAAPYVDLRRSGIPALVVLGPDGRVRTASNDGGFSDARTLDVAQLASYLTRWSWT